MSVKYSQLKAMLAIARGSFRSSLRSPSTVVFSIGFPLVFILAFAFLGNSSAPKINIAIANNADTTNQVYQQIEAAPGINIKRESGEQLKEDLEKGRITAILDIKKNALRPSTYEIGIITSNAVNPQSISILRSYLNAEIDELNKTLYPNSASIAAVSDNIVKVPGRVYRTIDFILPGQLGFSLLSAGIFGVAFLFFNLRQQLVLKRFFATPITRTFIVLGEALSRVVFQLLAAIIIIIIGVVFFDFTLVHGWITFLEIMFLSFFALIVFMGCGFIVSGLSKSESTIPPFANLFTLPQFLLAGTFFPIDNFPKWLQPFCNILPLTHFNNAMRNISFEGASLLSCWRDLGNLFIWGIIVYAIAIKVFKWE
ncbi:ABC transporter permease [Arachidicoccus sp.]|uniref:ABC transporter permease n=1 Tax=Arachidicoccus sp. TaxID=1872624 RepID=UPI003D1FF668